jgi:hypothetical protein
MGRRMDIPLPLKTGPKWRTYANKNLRGQKGEWKVEIKDSEGKVLKDVNSRWNKLGSIVPQISPAVSVVTKIKGKSLGLPGSSFFFYAS